MLGALITYRWHYSVGFITVGYLVNFHCAQSWFGFQDDFGTLICMVRRYNNTRLQYINNGVPLTHPPAIRLDQDYGI